MEIFPDPQALAHQVVEWMTTAALASKGPFCILARRFVDKCVINLDIIPLANQKFDLGVCDNRLICL